LSVDHAQTILDRSLVLSRARLYLAIYFPSGKQELAIAIPKVELRPAAAKIYCTVS
jgi:hypothetical protein